ncbi:MAG: methionine gamma-lyase family protein [Bacillota bacterium]
MIEKISKLIEDAEISAQELFKKIDKRAEYNQKKVIDAFRQHQISARHFVGTTGYGYDDVGRDTLGKVFATIFGAEEALVSPNILSGTHALTIALFGMLKTGDNLLCITGAPYDTLQDVISGEDNGSLRDYGIGYSVIDIKDNKIDYNAISAYFSANKAPKVVFMTRSRGYSWREALSIAEIEEAVNFIKKLSPTTIVAVDNCYGEFVDTIEPTEVGADVIIGSLIKNPGGGIAPTGGYIAGKSDVIKHISYRLTSPSIGAEVGSYNASYLPFYQGVFLAPSVVKNALKGCVLVGKAYSSLGYNVSPSPESYPKDIIRAIEFNTSDELVSFVQGVQYASPVDSYVTPEPWDMPGYQEQVIMAAGSFMQGASIELSADSPIKAPYIAYMQGGLTYEHCKLALSECLTRTMAENNKSL